jgi:hypothetical protein
MRYQGGFSGSTKLSMRRPQVVNTTSPGRFHRNKQKGKDAANRSHQLHAGRSWQALENEKYSKTSNTRQKRSWAKRGPQMHLDDMTYLSNSKELHEPSQLGKLHSVTSYAVRLLQGPRAIETSDTGVHDLLYPVSGFRCCRFQRCQLSVVLAVSDRCLL